jgi:hypothetical protein
MNRCAAECGSSRLSSFPRRSGWQFRVVSIQDRHS